MKRFLATLATGGLLVGLAAGPVAAAPGGITRNQITTNTYTLQIGNWHTYNNPTGLRRGALRERLAVG
jgi:hypothetical protein